MSTSDRAAKPSTSRCLKALRALGVATLGARLTVPGHTVASSTTEGPVTAPTELGDLEAIGYRHGGNVVQSEIDALVALGWFDFDHWVSTELAAALRRAGRTLTTTNPLGSIAARRLAHGAALGRIDVLRAATQSCDERRHPASSMARPTPTPEPVGVAAHRLGFHGGC